MDRPWWQAAAGTSPASAAHVPRTEVHQEEVPFVRHEVARRRPVLIGEQWMRREPIRATGVRRVEVAVRPDGVDVELHRAYGAGVHKDVGERLDRQARA